MFYKVHRDRYVNPEHVICVHREARYNQTETTALQTKLYTAIVMSTGSLTDTYYSEEPIDVVITGLHEALSLRRSL